MNTNKRMKESTYEGLMVGGFVLVAFTVLIFGLYFAGQM